MIRAARVLAVGTTIGGRLRDRVRAAPRAPAVEDGAGVLSYAELYRRAGALAAALGDAGVRRGDLVGLALDDPVDRIVAMVGTVRAGGAYLAMDGSLPPARVRQLAGEAPLRAVLARASQEQGGRAGWPVTVAFDAVPERMAAGARGRPPRLTGADLAAVYTTSGSTGRPKVVPLTHRGVVRLFDGAPPIDLPPGTRMGHAAHPMFDATTLEVWGPLLQGGTVVVLPRPVLLDPAALRSELWARRVDTLFVTTALLHEIAAREPAAFADLDTLYTGGEALDAGAAAAVLAAGRPRRFRNLYGPTETTTLATWHEVTAAGGRPTVPIGRPVPYTTAGVLGPDLAPVASGGVGELYVGGDGLGPGYLGRPGLTAAWFLPDPGRPGARRYRTGDLVGVGADGGLWFAGRRDRQVKIRGFRVEPEEVEAVLAAHPRVSACAVEAARLRHGQPGLVAYVAAADGLAAEEVRGYAAGRLPGHLVPSVVYVLPRLPATPAGKVDRDRLRRDHPPAGGPAAAEQAADEQAAADGQAADGQAVAAEERVAAVWAAVLGTPVVERTRNFFDAGGTSLLLMEVQAGLSEAVGWAPEIADLLDHPTVRAQARLIEAARPGWSGWEAGR